MVDGGGPIALKPPIACASAATPCKPLSTKVVGGSANVIQVSAVCDATRTDDKAYLTI